LDRSIEWYRIHANEVLLCCTLDWLMEKQSIDLKQCGSKAGCGLQPPIHLLLAAVR